MTVIKEIRAATVVFRDVTVAEAAGHVATSCASGGSEGAMGIHYVNPGLWAWRKNPSGAFADWNPHVTCEHHNG